MMKLYTHEEMLDSVIGVKDTPRRDEYEEKVDELRMAASDQE